MIYGIWCGIFDDNVILAINMRWDKLECMENGGRIRNKVKRRLADLIRLVWYVTETGGGSEETDAPTESNQTEVGEQPKCWNVGRPTRWGVNIVRFQRGLLERGY